MFIIIMTENAVVIYDLVYYKSLFIEDENTLTFVVTSWGLLAQWPVTISMLHLIITESVRQ